MMSSELPARRSILVTLEISDTGELALDIAARMAVISQAELEGVFIENSDLISLAKLPFLRQTSSYTSIAEAINPERMQCDLNAQARQAERMLIQCAKLMGLEYSFRIWKGQVTLASLNANLEADILGIVKSPAYRRHVVVARKTAIENIYVLFDGNAGSENALLAARQLANDLNVPIRVLLLAGSGTEQNNHKKIFEIVGPQKYKVDLIYYNDLSRLKDVLITARNIVLFMESMHPLFGNADFNKFLDTFTAPVLIVR
jgi:hypothetical protein